MGCRKQIWLCLFLCYASVYAECTHTSTSALPSEFNQSLPHAIHQLSKTYQKSEDNHNASLVTNLLNSGTTHSHNKSREFNSTGALNGNEINSESRMGYEKNIMLVLPVKPNATDANDTNLQMWYTQKPITAIIDDQSMSEPKHGMDYDMPNYVELAEDRHPYTNFLVNEMPSKSQKSPLHYGYPESSKFREDLNGSSNRTNANVPELASLFSSSTTAQYTTTLASSMRNDHVPESEKPITGVKKIESHLHTMPKISMKLSSTSQGIKLTTEAIHAEVTLSSVTTASSTTPGTIATTSVPISLSDIAVYNVTEDVDENPFIPESLNVIPLQNLSDFQFQINQFEPLKDAYFFNPDTQSTENEPVTKINQNISDDNILNNDITNMLVELGIIKPDQISTSTTEKVIIRQELVTPIYNSNSYNGFKKMPINPVSQNKVGISDDMNDLLASFGLIPKKKSKNETSGNRISRQQNLTKDNLHDLKINTTLPFNFNYLNINLSSSSGTNNSQINDDFRAKHTKFLNENELVVNSDEPMMLNLEIFPDYMKNTQEILGLLKQSSLHNRAVKSAHVFQPTSQLEKINQDNATKKITDVLRTIKSLSLETEANNITAEELEKQLKSITDSLGSDYFNKVDDTLLLNIPSNDTNLQLIESIDNMTSKFYSANESRPDTPTETSTTIIEIQPEIKTSSTTTEEIIQTTTLNTTRLQTPEMKPSNPLLNNELLNLDKTSKNEIKIQEQLVMLPSSEPFIESTTITSSINETSIPGVNTEDFNINTVHPNTEKPSAIVSTTTGSSTEIFNINTEHPDTEKPSAIVSTTTGSSTSSEENGDSKASANNNAPISALVDSFGGGSVASEKPTANDLPKRKPNGLYFYLDWNTFLNVGAEEDKRPIRIRFAPRAGNARNFLPITVP